jgi:hypothetical protein
MKYKFMINVGTSESAKLNPKFNQNTKYKPKPKQSKMERTAKPNNEETAPEGSPR